MITTSLARPAASATDDSSVNHSVRSEKLTKAVAPAKATVQHKPAKQMRHRIPPSQRFRVMQKYALGTNQTAIARDENLNRESVGRIVKSAEMEQFTEEIRERWRGLCDEAIQSVRRLIKKMISRLFFACSNRMGLLRRRGKFRISAFRPQRARTKMSALGICALVLPT